MKWKAEPIIHNTQARIALYFEYSKEANARVRQLAGVKWSNTLKVWHVPDKEAYRKQFKITTTPKALKAVLNSPSPIVKNVLKPIEEKNLTAEMISKIEAYKQWLRSRRYRENTVKTYSEALVSFLRFNSHKPVAEISNNDVIVFNNEFILVLPKHLTVSL